MFGSVQCSVSSSQNREVWFFVNPFCLKTAGKAVYCGGTQHSCTSEPNIAPSWLFKDSQAYQNTNAPKSLFVLLTTGTSQRYIGAREHQEHLNGLPSFDLPLSKLLSRTHAKGSNYFLAGHVRLPKHPTAAQVDSGCFPLLCKDSLKPKLLISPSVAVYMCSHIAHSDKGTMKVAAQGYSSPKGPMMSPSVKIQH